jgi:phospholipid/cholesterol/gamma-HCH transport system permease protein
MASFTLTSSVNTDILSLVFIGELSLYSVSSIEKKINQHSFKNIKRLQIDLTQVTYLDTAIALFFNNLQKKVSPSSIDVKIVSNNEDIDATLKLAKSYESHDINSSKEKQLTLIEKIGKYTYLNFLGFFSFMGFLGKLYATKLHYLKSVKNIRFKEIAFEINESGIKALGIISLTSFLIGIVVAYQSAFQLKLYGANIFIVDMLGISIFRELAPLITAIVIAGRSGSAFTAQIGAMKITQELDAMRTMGFDPYIFLVIPRILALMLIMPILIFVADMMGIIGGMVIANVDLKITTELFLERFTEVVAAKHFFIGLVKGPFFAFLIATISIYRGMMVKDDTQSIGFNTTKSVVESIFAVIVCDAIFSIAFTNLGI